MLEGLKNRLLHLKDIGKVWWFVLGAIWGAFWSLDAVIGKWEWPLSVATWGKYTAHFPFDWRIFVIGTLLLFLLLIIDGSYRHSKRLEAERNSNSPRIYAEVVVDFGPMLTPFTLTNQGNVVAHNIRIEIGGLSEPVECDPVDNLGIGQTVERLPKVDVHGSMLFHKSILHLLNKAWEAEVRRRKEPIESMTFPFVITYTDHTFKPRFQTEMRTGVLSDQTYPLCSKHVIQSC